MFGALRRYGNKHWGGDEGAAPVTGSPDMPFKDRALMALALLNKDYGAAVNIKQMAGKSAAAQAAAAAQAEIPSILTGRTHAKAYNGVAGPTTDGSQPAATSIPFAQRRAMLPNLRDPEVIRRLAEVEARGGDIGSALAILNANQADIAVGPGGEAYDKKDSTVAGRTFRNPTVVNDTILDLNKAENEERQVPQVGPGRMLVRDGQGNPYVMDIPGYAESEAARAGGVAGAQAAARTPWEIEAEAGKAAVRAPYEFESYTDAQGRPVKASRSALAGRVIEGQAPDDASYKGKIAEASAERYKTIQDSGAKAQGTIGRLRQMGQLLGDVDGGKLTPVGREVASYANSIGVKIDPKLGNKEAADALSNQIALDLMGGSLGAGFSNADRDFVTSMTPRLGQSAQGRATLIEIGVAKAQRDGEIAAKARQWQQRFGRLDTVDAKGKSFDDYLAEWAERNRLFGSGK